MPLNELLFIKLSGNLMRSHYFIRKETNHRKKGFTLGDVMRKGICYDMRGRKLFLNWHLELNLVFCEGLELKISDLDFISISQTHLL